jgi:hypothetical protein
MYAYIHIAPQDVELQYSYCIYVCIGVPHLCNSYNICIGGGVWRDKLRRIAAFRSVHVIFEEEDAQIFAGVFVLQPQQGAVYTIVY